MKMRYKLTIVLIILALCWITSCNDKSYNVSEICANTIQLPEDPHSVSQDGKMIYALCGGKVIGINIVTGEKSSVINDVGENALIDAYDENIAVCDGTVLSICNQNGKKEKHCELPFSDVHSLALTADYAVLYGEYNEKHGFYIVNMKTMKSDWTPSSLNIVQMCGAANNELILYIGDDNSVNSYLVNYDLKNDSFGNKRSLNISQIDALDYDPETDRTVYMYNNHLLGIKYIKSINDGSDIQTTDAVLDKSDMVSFVTCGAGTTAYTNGNEIRIVIPEKISSLSIAWFGEYDCTESRHINYEYNKQTGNIVNETVFEGENGLNRFKMKILAGEDDIDMYVVGDETAPVFVSAGAFYDIAEIGVSEKTLNMIKNNEEILSIAEYKEKIVGLPISVRRITGDDYVIYPGMENDMINSVNIIEYTCRYIDAVDGIYKDRSGEELMNALNYALSSDNVYETYSGPLKYLSVRLCMVNPSTTKAELVSDYLDFAADMLNSKEHVIGITPWNSDTDEEYLPYWKSYNVDCTLLLSDLFKAVRENSILEINKAVIETADKINLILTE